MFLFVMFNCGILITEMVLEGSNDPYDVNVLQFLSTIDDNFLYVYITECVMRIIGLGLSNYFEDDWNV
jgi:two pore calcium channel protein 3